MRKHLFIFICFLLAAPFFLYSQTAQEIEGLLNTSALNNQQAAWLVLEAADLSGPAGFPSQGEAFRYAIEQELFPSNLMPNERARLDQVSLLIMRSFNISGGLFYRLTGNRHYAYRELVYRNIIVGRADPEMAISGYDLLYMVNRLLSFQEDNLL